MHAASPQPLIHSSIYCGFITGKGGDTFVGGFVFFFVLVWFSTPLDQNRITEKFRFKGPSGSHLIQILL